MPADLHAHTTASDGSDHPGKLVELALTMGLNTLAVTDHDTQEGLEAAVRAAEGTDIELIPGTELSLQHEGDGMHLVVLWLEPGRGALQDRLAALREDRDGRNVRIVERLGDLGMEVGMEEVAEVAEGGSVGRPHIAAAMMGRGYVDSIKQAFDEWLAYGRPAYVGRRRLRPESAITLAREEGAVPVLAHPHTLGINRAEEMSQLLKRLRDAGLVGLEAMCSPYRRHERDGYADLARRFGLVPSGGSDYHGTYKPGIHLGSGYGDLSVPDAVVEELRSFAGRR